MVKKVLLFLLILVLSSIIGGLFGIVHDQVTYTISPEYFTNLKFYQFGLRIFILGDQRVGAVFVGILATWWMGLLIGLILGALTMLFNARAMMRQWFRAMVITLGTTVTTSLLVLGVWLIIQRLSPSPIETVYLPAFVPQGITVDDTMAFTAVAVIHNFSYLGGLLGLIAGAWLIVFNYRKNKITTMEADVKISKPA
jgi:hypothetical protein